MVFHTIMDGRCEINDQTWLWVRLTMLNFVFLFVVGWGIEGLDVCTGERFLSVGLKFRVYRI
jgi:hypothetical protein